MTRTVAALEGLAVGGAATWGPFRLSPPALLDRAVPGVPVEGLMLAAEPSEPGTRRLRLTEGAAELRLELPVLAPEVAPGGPAVHAVGPGTFLVHAPASDAELARLRTERPELVVLANARVLFAEGRPFVAAVGRLRAQVGAEPLLWAPRVALPHRVPLLTYLGIDLVDTTAGRFAEAEGERYSQTFGRVPTEAPDAVLPLLDEYRRAIAETHAALRWGRLRELVESRQTAEPALAELLRYADQDLADLLDQRSPAAYDEPHTYVLAESHRRPEMRRFRARLRERYRPPPSKTVLLLVPCSRTKPYRNSRSHRRFWGALEGLPHPERLHGVSVSSPIGVVPRELEDVPPARHYDIPVTGAWSAEEQTAVRLGLEHLLRSGNYHRAVVHLDPAEYDFLRPALTAALPTAWTLADDRTTSGAALAALRREVEAALAVESGVPGGPLAVVREELHEVAAVQFGRSAADRLFAPPVRLAGRPWFQRITDGHADLATLREERGLFQLTVAGARRIGADGPLVVRLDPAVRLAGDLFTPGVRSADPSIRVGDAVLLAQGEEIAGVGEAALPGPLMTELGRGLAVRVRHRAHGSTDTAKSEDEGPAPAGPVV
ncbi:MAG TPA: DUF5591 domain-containing protein [Thermoplasmata archaeon]|nr:DUF5591 domain-containing protein [Thermoplasmata archaeon]